ncbi:hypothetical protein [Bacillus sp. FSL H8-0515]|uniref:hypothetical protein n=1 Tax=Bacillus sp. FSL H8-0515 TaxID=2921396 RepID=UPI00228290D5|nr:hypothetical protein [Bacillus sp. S20C3]MCY8203484.1 hypothetical protein [Bacillus sp. N12A5]MCY8290420.1 hypothetical protein [Bacillus sp. N13C7]MCY8637150.1 hypothetical protein [Bacillus sp. S17B2]MCY8717797.1 hypothetical protein [Bacillus sp. S10C12M]MCY9144826.1 hypothetical protein [Bacillus sp. T9C1]
MNVYDIRMAPYWFYESRGLVQHPYVFRQPVSSRAIIASTRGDVTGDGVIDEVFLTGSQMSGSPLWRNITLVIRDGRTRQEQRIQLQNNMGYNPSLILGDMTGDKIDDVAVVIDTGGSGGAIYAYLFVYLNRQFRQIFNSDVFNNEFKYSVSYQNQYKANVISHHQNETYTLDLTYKGREYLNEIYTSQGVLKMPIEGWVNPLSGLYPVDFDRDGTYELVAYQRIAGRYNADSLGYVQTVLKWNGRGFSYDRQNVSIFGSSLT